MAELYDRARPSSPAPALDAVIELADAGGAFTMPYVTHVCAATAVI